MRLSPNPAARNIRSSSRSVYASPCSVFVSIIMLNKAATGGEIRSSLGTNSTVANCPPGFRDAPHPLEQNSDRGCVQHVDEVGKQNQIVAIAKADFEDITRNAVKAILDSGAFSVLCRDIEHVAESRA